MGYLGCGYGLNGWGSYDKVIISCCFIWKYAQKMRLELDAQPMNLASNNKHSHGVGSQGSETCNKQAGQNSIIQHVKD